MLNFEEVRKIILSINNSNTNKIKIPSTILYPEKVKPNYFKTIINTFANTCLEKDIICIIDTTLFKTGKDGFIFTKDKFYGNKYFKHNHGYINPISYNEIKSIGIDSNNHDICLISFKNGKQYRCNNGIYNMYICVILNKIIKEIAKLEEKTVTIEEKERIKEPIIKTKPKEEKVEVKQSIVKEPINPIDPYKTRLEYIANILRYKKQDSKILNEEELNNLKLELDSFSYYESLEYLYDHQLTNYLSMYDETITNELHLENLGVYYNKLRTNIVIQNNEFNNISYNYAYKSFDCFYQVYLNNRKDVLNDLITSILGLLNYDSIGRYLFNNEKAIKALEYVESIISDMKDDASYLNKVLIQKRLSSYYYETKIFQIPLLFKDTNDWKRYTNLLKQLTLATSNYYIKGYEAIFELLKHPIFETELKNIKKDLYVIGYENKKMAFPLTYSNHMIDMNNDQFRNACTYFETEQYEECYEQ